jgi:hypothetical protein
VFLCTNAMEEPLSRAIAYNGALELVGFGLCRIGDDHGQAVLAIAEAMTADLAAVQKAWRQIHGRRSVGPEKTQTETQGVNQAASLLFQHLRDHHDPADHTADLPPPRPFHHADPHLLASAMQKAVRRGDTEIARRAGHQLLAMDRSRFWRRLAVVALEDIGIADIEAAAELVAIALLPAARRLFGSDAAALDHALVRGCTAVKDRSGDHLGSILHREPVDPDQVRLLARASGEDLPIAARHRSGA